MTPIQVISIGTQGPAGPPSLSPDGVITTEGDLIIGGTGGTPTTLTVGDPGTFPGTADGATITNLRPGRVDARARGLSSADSDSSTLLATLATEAAANGAELWIAEGSYRGHVVAPSNLTMRGTGTIKLEAASAASGAITMNPTLAENVIVEGLTLDGNAVGDGVDVGTYNTVTNVVLRNLKIRNVGSVYAGNIGVRSWGDVSELLIEGCDIEAPAPIHLSGVQQAKVRNNVVSGGSIEMSNGITFWADTGGTMHGVEVTGNRIKDSNRIGIELYGGGGFFPGAVVSGNDVTIKDTYAEDAFGLSITASPEAIVHDNVIRWLGTGTPPTYGIELVNTYYGSVIGNSISNCGIGIIINSSAGCAIHANKTVGGLFGIQEVVSSTNSRYVDITENRIINARDFGISLSGYLVQNGGNNVSDNIIIRDAAWSGDSGRQFTGIGVGRQAIPSHFARNRIVQGQTSPTGGFVFVGLQVYVVLGDMEKSTITDTQFVDLKTGGAMMYTLLSNSGAPDAADIVLARNTLTNDTYVHSAVTAW